MSDKPETLGTVQRVVQVLRHLAETGETTIKDVSAALGLVPSTCHRMLELLSRDGIVERDPIARSYSVGPEFFRLAALVELKHDVRILARPFLQKIVDGCGETGVLSLYLPAECRMIFADKVDSSQLLRYQLSMNTPLPVLWGASGRAILAFLPTAEVDRVLKMSDCAPASGEKRPARHQLLSELTAVRERGYAISRGQKIAGAVGINAPVFGASDRVIGSLGVTMPEQRSTRANEAEISRLVTDQAEALSRALGASFPRPKSKVV
ncbi:IclR family acetate operon transcriptional repressor [Bradyrhizobium sp. AZCC 1678]|uniref:IclR family transcriptional regulator n=1 Tax=Bradyrhizobium sp. AZCC 1678 TaxID=3117030 RepID=UPI002FF0DFEA